MCLINFTVFTRKYFNKTILMEWNKILVGYLSKMYSCLREDGIIQLPQKQHYEMSNILVYWNTKYRLKTLVKVDEP